MPIPLIAYALITIALTVAMYLLSPKPKMEKLKPESSVDVPKTEIGRPLPVIFGTVIVRDPNVVWFGDLRTKAVKSEGGKK